MFATKTDGTLWSWGTNQGDWKGGLGQNDIINRSSPTQIGTDTNWFTDGGSFTAGGSWAAATKAP
jgi:alpha-tubulin suppressor-like RCC1 family protein